MYNCFYYNSTWPVYPCPEPNSTSEYTLQRSTIVKIKSPMDMLNHEFAKEPILFGRLSQILCQAMLKRLLEVLLGIGWSLSTGTSTVMILACDVKMRRLSKVCKMLNKWKAFIEDFKNTHGTMMKGKMMDKATCEATRSVSRPDRPKAAATTSEGTIPMHLVIKRRIHGEIVHRKKPSLITCPDLRMFVASERFIASPLQEGKHTVSLSLKRVDRKVVSPKQTGRQALLRLAI